MLKSLHSSASAVDAPEIEQGKLRLVIVPLAVIYFIVTFLWDGVIDDREQVALALGGVTIVLAVAIFAWMVFVPGINPVRRILSAVLDMASTSALMIITGEAGTVLLAMYLWVPIGHGFRYGRLYLHCAQVLAFVGFVLVMWLSGFWHQHPMIGAGVIVTLLAVPAYVSLLVARLQEARGDAESANIAKTKFLAAASHDLRQPMQALSMYATVLEGRVTDDNALRVVHGIQLSVATLERMFESLLDISKIESGVIKPTIATFALMPLLERVAESEAPIAAQKNLELRVTRTGAHVRSDPALLERMVKNLVTNAIRYTERGRIVIGCRRLGADRMRLDVIDSGIGIALGEQERIFDEYYQISGSSAQGLGLGLPIVKSLGALLGHAVSVKSAPGRGSVFSIELARAPRSAPPRDATQVPVAELSRLKVVLVDDDVQIRDSMGLLLQSWGCRTVAGGTVAEVERQLQAERIKPDALIVDYRLADAMSGIQVIERLRALFGRDLPAVLITGTANPAHLESRTGGTPILIKPVAPGRLRAFLSQALRTA